MKREKPRRSFEKATCGKTQGTWICVREPHDGPNHYFKNRKQTS